MCQLPALTLDTEHGQGLGHVYEGAVEAAVCEDVLHVTEGVLSQTSSNGHVEPSTYNNHAISRISVVQCIFVDATSAA